MNKTLTILSLVLLSAGISFAQLEYKDVAPIFYARCASCHHEHLGSSGAPFPLTNYSSTSSWGGGNYKRFAKWLHATVAP